MKHILPYIATMASAIAGLSWASHLMGYSEYAISAGVVGFFVVVLAGVLHGGIAFGKRSEVFEAHVLTVERLDEKVEQLDEKVEQLDGKVGQLDKKVGQLDEKVGQLDEKVDGLDVRIGTIETILTRIVSLLDKDNKHGLHIPLRKTSPLHLSKYGEDIAKNINADALVKKYAHNIDIPAGLNPYEIQQACFEYARGNLMNAVSEKEKEVIQINAYKSGDPVSFALEVMGVLFRDYWFKKQGIDADDADNHDPEPKKRT